MKRLFIILVFASITFHTNAQYSQNESQEVVIGTVDSLYSEIL